MGSRSEDLLWLGLLAGFSAVLVDLVENLWEYPEERYTLLAPILIALLLRRPPEPRGQPRVGAGAGLLLFALLALVFGIAANSWSIARLGLPIGIVAVSLISGRPAREVAALAFGAVPIPWFVHSQLTPTVESVLAGGAAQVLAAVGVQLEVGGPLLQYQGQRFELIKHDTGIVTAFVLAELGWYLALRIGRGPRTALGYALAGALLATVLHPLLVLLSVATLPLGIPGAGRFVLTYGPWLLLGPGLILATEHRSRSSPAPSGEASGAAGDAGR